MAKRSLPAAKFAVPSSGSTIQQVSPGRPIRSTQAGILLDRLLAHHRHAGQDPGQAGSQPLLGGHVGHGDDVAGPLEADVFLGERAEARQQLGRRRLAHQLGDPLRIAGAQHRVSRRRRTGPLPSGSRARRRRASLRCPTICRRSPCRRPSRRAARRRPSSSRLPLPTATTSPCMGFSWAVSGMMMPALVLVSAANGLSRSRSCKGLNFMMFPSSGMGRL